MLRLCSNYRKPETFYCWSTKSLKTCRFAQLLNAYVNYVEHSCYRHFFRNFSHFLLKGRVKYSQSEGGERERGEQEEDCRERQTAIKKSSADEQFTRCDDDNDSNSFYIIVTGDSRERQTIAN